MLPTSVLFVFVGTLAGSTTLVEQPPGYFLTPHERELLGEARKKLDPWGSTDGFLLVQFGRQYRKPHI